MKRMIAESKWQILISSIVILLPIPIGRIVGARTLWYPFGILLAHWLCLMLIFRDNGHRGQSGKAIGLALWMAPAVSLLVSSIYLMVISGAGGSSVVIGIFYFGFGLVFLVTGNYLPKVKRNNTIGIKVKWALEDDENWYATHRFAGKVWTAAGIACMCCCLFVDSIVSAILFIISVLSSLLPCAYSYYYHNRQVREGKAERKKISTKTVIVTLVVVIAVCAFIAWTMLSGGMEIVYGDGSFTVEASGWEDLTVNYGDIQSIEYQEQDVSDSVSGSRVNGMGNVRVSMGEFENEIYGRYTRYTYSSCDSCVVLDVNGKTVVLSGPDDVSTREIYSTLLQKVKI